jgi:hypothetical protein
MPRPQRHDPAGPDGELPSDHVVPIIKCVIVHDGNVP